MTALRAAAVIAVLLMPIALGCSEPLPTPDGESLELTLEGGARIDQVAGLDQQALVLDGNEGTYAHADAPDLPDELAAFRVEAKVRIDEHRAGTVAMEWPGAFKVYFDSNGYFWLITWPQSGQLTAASKAQVPLGKWTDVAAEYRAGDIGLLYVNGRSVYSFRGSGALTPEADRLEFGRHPWTDDEGNEHTQWMHGAVAAPRITMLPDGDSPTLEGSGMQNSMCISFGDAIVKGEGWRKLNSPDDVPPLIEELKRYSVTKVFLRCSSIMIMELYERRMEEDHWYIEAINAIEGDMHATIIDACHEAGIKVYAYRSIFDEGSPPSVKYGGNTPFIWQSKFTIEHPEYLRVNRDGTKRQWGVLCFAYPQAREYMVGTFEYLMERWDFDGIYICTRTHSMPAEFADQFGFNDPIVEEFQRRYGVNIREEEFPRSRWYDLQGEGLTELLREMRAAFPDEEIVIAIPRSDYIGPPYGNMRLDWRTWAQEGLVDTIRLGVISGGWHYPDTRNLPGYIQSQQDDVGMRPLEYDLGEWFGPWCEQYSTGLHTPGPVFPTDMDRELLELPGVEGFAFGFRIR
ncbi:MAG: LamG-like jellyroll fold domain-containing protein [Armatimonadota bacterium]